MKRYALYKEEIRAQSHISMVLEHGRWYWYRLEGGDPWRRRVAGGLAFDDGDVWTVDDESPFRIAGGSRDSFG